RGRALDRDLAVLDEIEVAAGVAVREDQAADLVRLGLDRARQAEDHLVGQVGEQADVAQARRELDLAARDPARRRAQAREAARQDAALFEVALAMPFEP